MLSNLMTGIVNVIDVVETIPVLVSTVILDSTEITGNSISSSPPLCNMSELFFSISAGNEINAEIIETDFKCNFMVTSGNSVKMPTVESYLVGSSKVLTMEDYIAIRYDHLASCKHRYDYTATFKKNIVLKGVFK